MNSPRPVAVDGAVFAEGARHLVRVDRRMAALVAAARPAQMPRRRGRYAALVRAIISQQVSTGAARAIRSRVQKAAGGYLSADRLAAVSQNELRAAGLSRQKIAYIADLTDRVRSRRLRLDYLHRLADEEVIAELTAVHGVGRWTAEMFLMFVLARPDVLPVGDLGIRDGFVRVYRLRKRPSPRRMTELSRPWRPYRSVGCWYLWRSGELAAKLD